MWSILRKSEVTFALKVSLLLTLVVLASSLKEDKSLAKQGTGDSSNGGISTVQAVFNNF